MWSRCLLIALRPAGLKLQLSVKVKANINNLSLRRLRRGCRVGKHSRLRPGRLIATEIATTREFPGTAVCRSVIPVMVGRRPSSVSAVKSDDPCVRATTSVRVLRHTTPVVQRLVFDELNVHSANNMIDEIMDVSREWLVAAAVSCYLAVWLWKYILGALQQPAGLLVAAFFPCIYSVC